MVKSGAELYFCPTFNTTTSLIAPSTIIGVNWASSPDTKDTSGSLTKFKTSDDPYPTP